MTSEFISNNSTRGDRASTASETMDDTSTASSDRSSDPGVQESAFQIDDAIASSININLHPLEGRMRRLSANIVIPHPLENVWAILTDYDHLSDFIPSLKESKRVESPTGKIHIEQIGSQSIFKLKFCARVVLDMIERFPNRIDFRMLEGDFKEFHGAWILNPWHHNSKLGTELTYTVDVLPSRIMPVGIIEKKLSHNLRVNLAAIYGRTNAVFGEA